MSRAWQLPEHIADVLPARARHLEALRRRMLDQAATRGFELVMPPMLEHLESLLSGTGQALDLRTFKLVDQLSGRLLGLRADTTPQAARIDAHLLNRAGVTRLCYCGPVLHTLPATLLGSREPLQLGAEIFGHAGLEADLEVQELAVDALAQAGLDGLTMDLADARILRGVLAGITLEAPALQELSNALAGKDAAALALASAEFPGAARAGLAALLRLYGGTEVLAAARSSLPSSPLISLALDELQWLTSHVMAVHPALRVGFDLADTGSSGYYSGARFALYARATRDALARGGRYDEVGAVFGRSRPAVGFSLDLKAVAEAAPGQGAAAAIRAPWSEDAGLRQAVRRLRDQGETVVWALPGHADGDAHAFDRELVELEGRWLLQALPVQAVPLQAVPLQALPLKAPTSVPGA